MKQGAAVAGIAGGIAGGVAFGILMAVKGMLPMVAQLVGSSSPAVGFIVHLGISAVIGITYGLLVSGRIARSGPSVVAGTGYGILWWVLGPLTLMPLFMGMGLGVNWNLEAATNMLPSLYGHIMFGLVLALTYRLLGRRLGVVCGC